MNGQRGSADLTVDVAPTLVQANAGEALHQTEVGLRA